MSNMSSKNRKGEDTALAVLIWYKLVVPSLLHCDRLYGNGFMNDKNNRHGRIGWANSFTKDDTQALFFSHWHGMWDGAL